MDKYPWVCVAYGIVGYGNSHDEALADWAEQYHLTFSE